MSDCCHEKQANDCHSNKKKTFDWILWVSVSIIFLGLLISLGPGQEHLPSTLVSFSDSILFYISKMWWGLLFGIFFVGVMSLAPKEFVSSIIGRPGSFSGIIRATLAGLLLDLCSHGILIVGMNLYKKGASLGQVYAFLISSPWNSLSLTIILISLIGLKWTFAFIVLSMIVAVFTGLLVDWMQLKWNLPMNPNSVEIPENFQFWKELRAQLGKTKWNFALLAKVSLSGIHESKMIIKWIFFGAVLAAAVRAFIDPHTLHQFFGPSLVGLGLTLVAATVIEVCSEGSTPIATELLTRAAAPGNAFTFLMAGVATDYTELLAIRETTKSWKLALLLPLASVPQILLISYVLNNFHL